ncbi:MAG: cyclic nucleotide-binding domain-containing protein [Rhizobiales bacterium]|nr:cyclic nucleotide-binding domain-containing protein [Hyphomicrobiales bacterium]MBO6699248.1 cyclic nucleotide-binding domain-containing protein [Hyphomicrobiales bacterium]MBO6736786.1 cyclic nucleotide-binding domain-containing protein [Hyphomicrobiales bacterium]MBO6912140.1 cyclic nucleotide-binding domain-containing protein [Hyphomicrobiales bacterium]MBO6956974.1 cyclic nucleotide-binding domain-containing protein [Hyphomicrobiales bacterium]
MDVTVWIEAIGWMASAITIATYAMNTMVPLRVLAMVSSVLFIAYAMMLQLWPLLVMEAILLPINGFRLWQILSLRGRLEAMSEDDQPDFSVVRRYGKKRRFQAGTQVFEKGDAVDKFYLLETGRVLIEELETELSEGSIFGEIAFFTVGSRRTASARCLEDVLVYELDKERFMRLQFEDPSFGLAVMRIVTSRLISNGAAPQAHAI